MGAGVLGKLVDYMAQQPEGVLWRFLPEVFILRYVVVGSGGVGNHPHAREGHIADIANLGDGGRLHVNGVNVGIMAANAFEHFWVGHKNVAGAYQPVLHGVAFLKTCKGVHAAVGVEKAGTSGCVAPLRAGTAPNVMVGYTCPHHDVEHSGIAAGASGHSGVDYKFRLEVLDHHHRSEGGVHFAYAALHGYDVCIAYGSAIKSVPVNIFCGAIVQERYQKLQLLVHRYNYAYFHLFGVLSWYAAIVMAMGLQI